MARPAIRRQTGWRVASALLVAVLPATGGTAAPAAACYNEVEQSLEPQTRAVSWAERLLRRDRTRRALRLAVRAEKSLDRVRVHPVGSALARVSRLRARAERIVAVATVRLDGAVTRERGRAVRRIEDAARRANLEWAREVLGTRAADTEAPVDRARYAEALASLDDRRDQALGVLRSLAEADLMPDARAYALLADLAREAGEGELADDASERCRGMAGRRARRTCPAPAPDPSPELRDRS